MCLRSRDFFCGIVEWMVRIAFIYLRPVPFHKGLLRKSPIFLIKTKQANRGLTSVKLTEVQPLSGLSFREIGAFFLNIDDIFLRNDGPHLLVVRLGWLLFLEDFLITRAFFGFQQRVHFSF